MPKNPCEIVILDIRQQRTIGTSKFFHMDFYNISICKYVVIKLRYRFVLSSIDFFSFRKKINRRYKKFVIYSVPLLNIGRNKPKKWMLKNLKRYLNDHLQKRLNNLMKSLCSGQQLCPLEMRYHIIKSSSCSNLLIADSQAQHLDLPNFKILSLPRAALHHISPFIPLTGKYELITLNIGGNNLYDGFVPSNIMLQ